MSETGIFNAAVKLPPERRAAYLDQACGTNHELRREVESLLQAHEQSGSFLQSHLAPSPATVDHPSITEKAGTIIGPYKLMEQIGEGGFGLVFVAEQQQPVRRKVALKIIKPGMDTRDIIARFEAERQALALMDHPNIAKVFDAGATDSGRPYFVMELVRGIPIVEYCDQQQLTARERLDLFLSVCQAVQHAHGKGIIHRDLKPSNILVAPHDGVPVVKVIDFGVAKAIGQQLTDKTIYTRFNQMIGTPLYMSPEQAEVNALDVDIRSDVYSLGVLLYELLTGTTPFDRQRFATAAYDEIRRIIKEEEPPKPSTRLSTLGESLSKISSQRKTEPAKLSALVKGDLDWIVMKALEKDRGRRYDTASAFAADVRRFLAEEPIEARPPSTWYRFRKLARRNKVALTTTALVAAALVIGTAVSIWQAVRATVAEQQANQNLEAEQQARKDERKAREDERKARQRAFAALRSMTSEVVERKFAQGTVLTDDDRAFLRSIIAQFDAFAEIKGDDADSRAVQAEGRHRVGVMRHRLGEFQEAEKDYDQALRICKQLAADFPANAQYRHDFSAVHISRGALMHFTGRPKQAEEDYDQALTIQTQLAADYPSRPEFSHMLAKSHLNRGLLRCNTGRLKDGEQDYKQATHIYQQLVAKFPSRAYYREELAMCYNNRGMMMSATGRTKDAEKDYDRAASIRKQLVADFPSRPDFRQQLADTFSTRGNLLRQMGQPREAEKDYDQALIIQKQLAAEFPARPAFRLHLANSYASRGVLLGALRRLNEEERDHDQALSLLKQLVADFPSRSDFRRALAQTHNNHASVLRDTGRRKEANLEYDETLRIQRQLAAEFPNQPDLRNEIAGTFVNQAILFTLDKNWATAKRLLLEGRPHHLAALEANPRQPIYRLFYRNHLNMLSEVHAGLLEPEDAVRTAEIRRDLGWDAPDDAYDAACYLGLCVPIVAKHDKLDDKQRKDAVQFYGDAAMKLLREATNKGFKNAAHMKKDTDLDPLRQREDFKQFIAELEGRGK